MQYCRTDGNLPGAHISRAQCWSNPEPNQCSHVQLLDVVDSQELFGNYVYVSGTSPSFVKHFEHYASQCPQPERQKPAGRSLISGSHSPQSVLQNLAKYPTRTHSCRTTPVDQQHRVIAHGCIDCRSGLRVGSRLGNVQPNQQAQTRLLAE